MQAIILMGAKMKADDFPGVVIVDLKSGAIIDCDGQFCRLTGLSKNNLVGRIYATLSDDKDFPDVLNVCRISFSGVSFQRTFVITSVNEQTCAVILLKQENREKAGFLSESLLNEILDILPAPVYYTNREGTYLGCNIAFTEYSGLSKEDITGKKASEIIPEENIELFSSKDDLLLKNGINQIFETSLRYADGTDHQVVIFQRVFHEDDNNISGIVGVILDITERKSVEKALVQSEERFRELVENATIGIYRTSPSGKFKMANLALLNLFGYDSLQELKNIDISREGYVNPGDRETFILTLNEVGRIYGFESKWKKKTGEIIFIRESARAVRDKRGKLRYYEGVIEDITEKKDVEFELIEARKKAEESDKLKSEFLAQVSHEIRTPLNAILSFLELVRLELDEKNDKELLESFAVIDSSGRRLTRTVDMILNMAQLQAGTYQPTFEKFDLYYFVLLTMTQRYYNRAKNKGLELELVKKCDMCEINADIYSVQQIFRHLIDNAIKFTEKGSVLIEVSKNSSGNIVTSVSDTGIGIGDEYLPFLFETFSQEDKGLSRRFDGNGLGLALVKKYCDLNNAVLEINSEKGKGSFFRITFPHE